MNEVKAAQVAGRMGCKVVGLLGRDGGTILPLCDAALVVPSQHSFLIQEISMIVGHWLCDVVEQALFAPKGGV